MKMKIKDFPAMRRLLDSLGMTRLVSSLTGAVQAGQTTSNTRNVKVGCTDEKTVFAERVGTV